MENLDEEEKHIKATKKQVSPKEPYGHNNIEKVVQRGDYLYYFTKDSKDKPLD